MSQQVSAILKSWVWTLNCQYWALERSVAKRLLRCYRCSERESLIYVLVLNCSSFNVGYLCGSHRSSHCEGIWCHITWNPSSVRIVNQQIVMKAFLISCWCIPPPLLYGLPNYGWINEAPLLLLLLRQSHIGSIHCVGVVVDPRVNIRTLCVKLFCFFFVLPFLTLPQVLLPISVAPSLLFPFAGGNDVGLRGRCCWQAWEWVLLFHQRAIINENWSRFCE